jgi:hypothetical protein
MRILIGSLGAHAHRASDGPTPGLELTLPHATKIRRRNGVSSLMALVQLA